MKMNEQHTQTNGNESNSRRRVKKQTSERPHTTNLMAHPKALAQKEETRPQKSREQK